MANADLKQGLSLLAVTPASGQLSTTSATTVFTCAATSTTQITTFSLTNVTATAVTVSVSVVPSGGSAASTNRVVSSYSIPANDSTLIKEVIGGYYPAGTFFVVTAGTANAVNYALSGLVGS